MSLPPPPLALAGYAPTQAAHRELDAIVAKYGQQCREAALDEAAMQFEGVRGTWTSFEAQAEIRSLK